jgi:preprotein translocase SecE subunit
MPTDNYATSKEKMSKEPTDDPKPVRPDQPKMATSLPTPKMKRGLKGFLNDVSREMKKVAWPSRAETNRLTFVVLTLVVSIAVMVSLMGWASEVIVALITKGRVS